MGYDTAQKAFSADSYDTPEDTRRYPGDRILFNSRWWLYLRFASAVIKSYRLAIKGKYDDEALIKSSFRVFQHIEGCGGRFHIRGLDNLRKTKEPLVIVSNHMSTMEGIIFPCIISPFRAVTYVVKESLVTGRFFAYMVRTQKPIVVSRTNPREDFRLVMEEGQQALENGLSLVIFPQATRSLEFNPEKFNTLGVKLARNTGVKILPLAIKTDFWGHSKIIKGFGPLDRKKPIYMTFGEPITIKGNGKEEHQQIIRFIGSHLEKWQQPANPQVTD
ncbi:MAG: 1-acyl-sn-glycerol-3-phosphate acyltransferase [Candidatus Aminicenantes bacterium]|nr:MAG: 1-acyl-sn-glycerol-3-phosphate acyltransferase [Candidatus Aminicenantes bacterium]